MQNCIVEEHGRRWDAAKGQVTTKDGGCAKAVLLRMSEKWPELSFLMVSDVINKKASFFKGAQQALDCCCRPHLCIWPTQQWEKGKETQSLFLQQAFFPLYAMLQRPMANCRMKWSQRQSARLLPRRRKQRQLMRRRR